MLMPVSYIQVNGNRITELVNYVMMLVALQSDFPYKDSKKKKKKSFFIFFFSFFIQLGSKASILCHT